MSERRTIGQILTSLGRITDEDVTTALQYQKDEGGFFGEALMACGLVSQEELDWGIASQFDLPYVHPESDSVDLATASLVSPEWALAHLTLPLLQTGTSLKVVIDSPMKAEPIAELAAKTGLEVDVALSSSNTIRELIREVFARASAAEEEHGPPVEIVEALDMILLVESPRFGVSVRGVRAWVWWDEQGTIRRRRLAGDWRAELDRVLVPSPMEMTADTMRTAWEAEFTRAGASLGVRVDYLADESGREFLFKQSTTSPTLEERFTPPSSGVVSEVRLLARSGTARFVVTADPEALGHEILPHLPALLLDPSWRSIYINAEDQAAADEAFSLQVPNDPSTWEAEFEALRAFHFDVATVDLSGGDHAWAGGALDVASVAFLLWNEGDDLRPAYEAGIRWVLRIERSSGDELSWSLEALPA